MKDPYDGNLTEEVEAIVADSPEHCKQPAEEGVGIGFIVGTGLLLTVVLALVFATAVLAEEVTEADIISVTLNPGEAVIIPIYISDDDALIITKRVCAAHIVSDSRFDVGTLEKWAFLRSCKFTFKYTGPVEPKPVVEDG